MRSPDSRERRCAALMKVAVVVPCFNEAQRLELARFLDLARSGISVLFVDDGSTDATRDVIEVGCASDPMISVLLLPDNLGKGEAVRHGILHLIDSGAGVVGYVDADLAAPPEELLRLLDLLVNSADVRVVTGARVRLMGTTVERSMLRHHLSRLFATLASLALREKIYDTQCGMKLFRVDERLRIAVSTPFRSRWIFDIELLDRLFLWSRDHEPGRDLGLLEVPLKDWKEVGESKLTVKAMLRASVDLMFVEYRRRRGNSQV